jgi:protein SCO1/2
LKRLTALAFVVSLALAAPGAARAQRTEPLPEQLEGVGITEHRDAKIPLDLAFSDEDGRAVRLRDYFHEDRPVVLTLVYYSCPMLCTLVLNGLTDAMRDLSWEPGAEYEVVTVSFDPRETSTLARLKKQNYLSMYGRAGAGAGWHFLTGREEEIHALTEAVGFGYRWDEEQQQFAHQAAIFVLTPDGRISRYLYGVLFEPLTLKLTLLEASKGKIGSPLDQIVLYCYHYDPKSGSYAPAAMRFMRLGGVLTMVLVGAWLSSVWLRSARRRPPVAPPAPGH